MPEELLDHRISTSVDAETFKRMLAMIAARKKRDRGFRQAAFLREAIEEYLTSHEGERGKPL